MKQLEDINQQESIPTWTLWSGLIVILLALISVAFFSCLSPVSNTVSALSILCVSIFMLNISALLMTPFLSKLGMRVMKTYVQVALLLTIVYILLAGVVLYCHAELLPGAISFSIAPAWLGDAALILFVASCIFMVGFMWNVWRLVRGIAPVLTDILLIGAPADCSTFLSSLSLAERRYCRFYSYTPSRNDEENTASLFELVKQTFFPEKAFFLTDSDHSALRNLLGKQWGIELWQENTAGKCVLARRRFCVETFIKSPGLMKFFFDQIGAVLLFILSSPVWVVAFLAIHWNDKGSAFYKQARSGIYGKHFYMWKFRTMYADADKRLEEIKKTHGNEMDGPIFKLKDDPRIFPIGKILRKLSIDELPQIINVFLGDMSIVGPRPLPVYETEAFQKIEYRRRLCVLPGLTCYWQIEGRSDITKFDDLIQLDFKYIDSWNPALDAWLVLRTVPSVLLGKGAS